MRFIILITIQKSELENIHEGRRKNSVFKHILNTLYILCTINVECIIYIGTYILIIDMSC